MAGSERAAGATEAGATTGTAEPATGADTGGRHEGGAAADTSTLADLTHLRFEAITNGRYHTARQGWYELLHRISMFVVVLGGTTAVADAVGSGSRYSWMIALIPTLAGMIDLVFDFAGKAALHARLQERSYDIVADIEHSSDPREVLCRKGWAAIARICAQEPKTMRAVHALAYNDTKEGAEENASPELLVVPLWIRSFKHLFAFDGRQFKRAKELHGLAE